MKEKTLYILWGALFILCAGLGFIPEATGFGRAVLTVLGILFFVPGAILLFRAIRENDRKQILQIRFISGCWLLLTLILLVANLLSVNASETAGNILYGLLVVLSSPLVCGQYWELILFLWACLLTASFLRSPKTRKNP